MYEWKEPSFLEIADHKEKVELWHTQNEEYLSFLELSKRLYAYDAIYLEARKKHIDEELRLLYASDQLGVLQHNSLSIFLDSFPINFDEDLLTKYCVSFASIYKEFIKATNGTRGGVKLVLTYSETFMTESSPKAGLVNEIFDEINSYSLEYNHHIKSSRELYGYGKGLLTHLDSILISRKAFSENTVGKQFFEKQKISHIPIFPSPPVSRNRFNGVNTCFQKMREAEKSYLSLHDKVRNFKNDGLRNLCDSKAAHELLKIRVDKLLYGDDKNSQRANELLDKEKELQALQRETLTLKEKLREYEESDILTVSKLKLIAGALIRLLLTSPENKADFGTWKKPKYTVVAKAIKPFLDDTSGKALMTGMGMTKLQDRVLEFINELKKIKRKIDKNSQ